MRVEERKKGKRMMNAMNSIQLFLTICLLGCSSTKGVTGVNGMTDVKQKRTVIIGDSMYRSGLPFFRGNPSPLSKWLETWSGHSIENYALVGASLEKGWIKSIREQFDSLSFSPNITTLVMDGGGNDVMSHKEDCLKFNDRCEEVMRNSETIARSIIEDSRKKGVNDIIYLGFYKLEGLEKAVETGNRDISNVCQPTNHCYFVNPVYNETTKIGIKVPEMIGSDHVHPTEEGYKMLAEMIWNVTEENNIVL
jgi:hypothetical protein